MFTIKIGLDESRSSKFNFSIFEIHKQTQWFFFTFSQFFTNKAITFYAEYDDMQIWLPLNSPNLNAPNLNSPNSQLAEISNQIILKNYYVQENF